MIKVYFKLHSSNLCSLKKTKKLRSRMYWWFFQTICGSEYETPEPWNYSCTAVSKLMDQLKVFVGMAIFLSQMVTSHGITSVSNSASYQHAVKSRGEMDPLAIYPHSVGEAHGGHDDGSSDKSCYFVRITHPLLFLQFGACCKHALPPRWWILPVHTWVF